MTGSAGFGINGNIQPAGFPTKEQDILSFPQDFFPSFLRHAQNSDGGWGYRPGLQSCTEPTAWSILALRTQEAITGRILSSASNWLRRAQLSEGAWPTSSGKEPGCWMTALACLALLRVAPPSDDAIGRGLKWLCETWPAEGGLLWRVRHTWLRNPQSVIRQDCTLRGWSWTPNTASWVEPTAYALILLQNVPEQDRPRTAMERVQLAERMLYNRACPGGGWNAGNPLVYGVPGVPRIGPTVWALLALRHNSDHLVNQEGLEWLERNYEQICSPGSLALTFLCLKVYGRPAATIEPELHKFFQRNQFLQGVPVVAWASLALSGVPDWLQGPFQTKGNA